MPKQYIIKEKDWKTVLDKAAFKEEDWVYINKITDAIYSQPYDPQSECNKLFDTIVTDLKNAIDERTRTFKGLHEAIKIVENIRKKPRG